MKPRLLTQAGIKKIPDEGECAPRVTERTRPMYLTLIGCIPAVGHSRLCGIIGLTEDGPDVGF